MILKWQQQKTKVGEEGHHTAGGEGRAGPISRICRISYGA